MSAQAAEPSGGSCLGASAALELAAGRLANGERVRAERHIEHCPACEFVVATAREQRALELLDVGSAARVGSVLAQRYRLLRLAGRGGMGEVFEAHDELLDARIAVKCLAPRWAEDGAAHERLKREVLLARRVSHPNVARVFDFGLHSESGRKPLSFLTMEYVDGGSLRQRIAGRAQPARDVRCIVEQLLLALAQAHRVGVLHRDLKSDNILLRDACSAAPSIVVTDFGLARAITPEHTHVSASQLFLGTPGYLAPEQLQGGRLTVRSDLYSLGIITFELLTGSLPFLSNSALATAMQRLQQRAPRISERTSGVPHAWDEFVMRCLEREPARRYDSAEQALAALPPEQGARASAAPRRSRSRISVRGLAFGLVLGALLDDSSVGLVTPLPLAPKEPAGGASRSAIAADAASAAPVGRGDALRSAPFQLLAIAPSPASSIAEIASERGPPVHDEHAQSGRVALPPEDPPEIAAMNVSTSAALAGEAHDFIDPFAASPE